VVAVVVGVAAFAIDTSEAERPVEVRTGRETVPTLPPRPCDGLIGDVDVTAVQPDRAAGWRRLPAHEVAERSFPVTVWTGEELVVWSGEAGRETAVFPTGAAYDRAADAWHPIADAPDGGRAEATAVWTGHEVLVWGASYAFSDDRRQGMAYDPDADAWRSLARAPVAATEFAASVWTGTEMVVIGGTRGGGVVQSEAAMAYDPVCDRWRPLPEPPVAFGRFPTAVWTGREVVVWDGERSQGAALDPETGRWRTLGASGLPDLYHPSVVWTGEEMVVWGWVYGTTGEENAAAAYDPATDSWRSLPPAPLVRPEPCECNGGQAAVWAGDRMLAWSGTLDAEGPLMLSLDPATGEWQRLARLDGDALYHPSMVWTGAEAIVGARYAFTPPP
jgi:hypothetical protein